MLVKITFVILSMLVSGLSVWLFAQKHYERLLAELKDENSKLKNQADINENVINEIKLSFADIASQTLKNQQEAMLNEHSKDLRSKIDLFKAEEIAPVNRLLKEFKDSIDNYQKSHHDETLEIKNAISTAEKYAKALTAGANSKGEFGEQWLEQILKFADLKENVHYTKQYVSGSIKPDFVVNLPEDKHIIIDSKTILKNFIDYGQSDGDAYYKKCFIEDLKNCIVDLGKKNYEEAPELNQPGFILMYIPLEACVNMIYTDYDFKNVIELAASRNIIITGTSSLLVTLRLINQLWASQTQYDNVRDIITVGENLYNNISSHAERLLNIQKVIDGAAASIKTEINRFTARKNGSIFKEAEKLREFGISSKEVKSGKKLIENSIPKVFLEGDEKSSEIEDSSPEEAIVK